MNYYNRLFLNSGSIRPCSLRFAPRSLIGFAVAIVLALSGCSQAPSESDARNVYENMNSEMIKNGTLELLNFRKVNAQTRDFMGDKAYVMEYEAEVRYPKGLNPDGLRRGAGCFDPPDDAICLTLAYSPGRVVKQKGELEFKKTEKGWKGKDGQIYSGWPFRLGVQTKDEQKPVEAPVPPMPISQQDPAEDIRNTTSLFSPQAVWKPSVDISNTISDKCSSMLAARLTKCIVSKMRADSASDEAIKVVEYLKGDAYLIEFREFGRVDLAVLSQFSYNSPELGRYEVLVNGTPPLVNPMSGENYTDIRKHPKYAALARNFPQADLSSLYAFQSIQKPPSGGQQFIFNFSLVNGCRACERAGNATVAFNFDNEGKFIGTKLLGLESEASQDWAPSFDCAKATTGSERMICSNKELAEADVRMVQLYKAARNNSPNKEALTREQNNWRKNVRDACAETTCLLRAYQDRIAQLSR